MNVGHLLSRYLPEVLSRYLVNKRVPQRADRRHRGKEDQRSPYQRDRDRVLYTEHFNRLSGVTQVARTGESYLYHDRQSHSLKVAQVGRRLTEYLINESDEEIFDSSPKPNPDVVETAALAHDLGHPPFGHIVEKELHNCVQDRGIDEGFEANAQSFRVVTQLSTHRNEYPGLDLTRASLNAILKYPWAYGENKEKPNKWGYFESEKDDFDFARGRSQGKNQSIEAQLMDWSDDVAYAVHDMEDFFKAGLLPLDRILVESEERQAFLEHLDENTDNYSSDLDPSYFLDQISNIAQDSLRKPYTGSPKQKAEINMLTSHLIERYLGEPNNEEEIVYLSSSEHDGVTTLMVDPILKSEVEILKELTKYYIINDSALMAQQHGQRKVVRKLFDDLADQALPDSNYRGLIPSPYKDKIDELNEKGTKRERIRVVTDLITRLTEQQTLLMHERLEGTTPGSLQDRIIR